MATKHYYSVLKGTALYEKLEQFMGECRKAEQAAEDFAKSVGAELYYGSAKGFTGGVMCVSFPEDTEPDERIWEKAGKDSDGIQQWQPAVECRWDAVIANDEKKPKNTPNRVYGNVTVDWLQVAPLKDEKGWQEVFKMPGAEKKQLIEEMKKHKYWMYARLTATKKGAAAEAVRIERERMLLPVVQTKHLYQILEMRADEAGGGKNYFRETATPTLFQWQDRFYISIERECHADGLRQLSRSNHERAVNALTSILEHGTDGEG